MARKEKEVEKGKGKGKGKEKEVSESLQTLRDVAGDMNEVMGLEPAIDTDLEDEDELKEAIEEEAKQIEAADEKTLEESTWEFLKEEGFLDHLEEKKEKKGKGKEKEKEEAPAKGKDKGKEKDKAKEDKDKPKKAGPPRGPTNELGHAEGSQGDAIDQLLLAGKSTQEGIEKALVKEFKIDEGKAKARVKSHLKHLENDKGLTIDTDKKGIMSVELPKKSKK